MSRNGNLPQTTQTVNQFSSFFQIIAATKRGDADFAASDAAFSVFARSAHCAYFQAASITAATYKALYLPLAPKTRPYSLPLSLFGLRTTYLLLHHQHRARAQVLFVDAVPAFKILNADLVLTRDLPQAVLGLHGICCS